METKPLIVLREPAEIRFAAELEALVRADDVAKPSGWRLSPRAVRTFILGSSDDRNNGGISKISRKFYGDDGLVDRAIVSLMSNRGLLLIGEPGCAKSLLSELLCAAISGTSTRTVQGTAATTEEQIMYSWNKAILQAEGPSLRALVPAPIYHGLAHGQITRFEEIARCPAHILDSLISVISDKVLHIPELPGDEGVLLARPGFNVLATANTRDKGIKDMSAALKRRFSFEIVAPISNKVHELQIVRSQAQELLAAANAHCVFPMEIYDLLVTAFLELRLGRTEAGAGVEAGTGVEKPDAVMSTAEAIAVAFACGLEAFHFGDGHVDGGIVAHHLIGTVLKDNADDAKRLRHYFQGAAKKRSMVSPVWKSFIDAGRGLLA